LNAEWNFVELQKLAFPVENYLLDGCQAVAECLMLYLLQASEPKHRDLQAEFLDDDSMR